MNRLRIREKNPLYQAGDARLAMKDVALPEGGGVLSKRGLWWMG